VVSPLAGSHPEPGPFAVAIIDAALRFVVERFSAALTVGLKTALKRYTTNRSMFVVERFSAALGLGLKSALKRSTTNLKFRSSFVVNL
jgi:hypothetical protein